MQRNKMNSLDRDRWELKYKGQQKRIKKTVRLKTIKCELN